jgi:N-acetylmuramoyl-L-alanine amidase
MALNRNSYDYQTLLKTVYAEARGEDERGQRAVAWVIKHRADLNRDYWGGNTIAGVCRKPGQFECWNGRGDIEMSETRARDSIDSWLPNVYLGTDYSGGSDHYNNPTKEGYPDWTRNCRKTVVIGNHQFYKGP